MSNLTLYPYDRALCVSYARKWAYARNPAYYDFSNVGGDCTNFASQCLYAGSKVMNFTPVFGWFYRSANDRTASWTGVEFLYRFLLSNQGEGPFAEESDDLTKAEIGDLIQLGRATGDFYHTPEITKIINGIIFVSAHSYDTFDRPLSSYRYEKIRLLHILGVRKNE